MWLKIKQEGLRRFWSIFPLTRVPFWSGFLTHSHICSSIEFTERASQKKYRWTSWTWCPFGAPSNKSAKTKVYTFHLGKAPGKNDETMSSDEFLLKPTRENKHILKQMEDTWWFLDALRRAFWSDMSLVDPPKI